MRGRASRPHAVLDGKRELPEVNAVVVFVLALTVIPVAIAVRLTGGGGITRSSVHTTPDDT
jgi:hypothetical protein